MRFIGFILGLFIGISSYAQCVDASFSGPVDACVGESIVFTNEASGALYHSWDFCPGDLMTNLEATTTSTFSNATNSESPEIVYDGSDWIGFIIGQNTLYRFELNDSLNTISNVIELGNISSKLNRPTDLHIIQEGSNWYGIVSNYNDNSLVIIDFGVDLSNNTPTANTVPGALNISRPTGIDIAYDSGNLVVAVANSNQTKISLINFGNSVNNTINADEIIEITTTNAPTGVEIINLCDQKFLFATGASNSFMRLTFNGGLFSLPDINETMSLSQTIFLGYDIESAVDNGNHVLFVSTNNSIYRLNFETDLSGSPVIERFRDLSADFADLKGIRLIQSNSLNRFFLMNSSSKKLIRVDTENNCNADIPSSQIESPPGISYDTSGKQYIQLISLDSNRAISFHYDSIMINNPPEANFTHVGFCPNVPVVFTDQSSSEGTIQTWEWEIDGIFFSNEQSPENTFTTSGDYLINLLVTDNYGCQHDTTYTLTIIEEDDITPDFSYDTPTCSNNTINFSDESVANQDAVVGWVWDLNGTVISGAGEVEYEFNSAGEHTVQLTVLGSSGCEYIVSKQITVDEGPEIELIYSNNCLNDSIQFEIVGETHLVDSVHWDFGDTFSSQEISPSHKYAEEGLFGLTLNIYASNGCISTIDTIMEISNQPRIDMDYGLPVENLTTSVNGLDYTLGDDSILTWTWKVNGDTISNEQSFQTIFSDPEQYEIQLFASSSQGCTYELTEVINVTEAECPTAYFSTPDTLCLNEKVPINNSTANASAYQWSFCESSFKNHENSQVVTGTNGLLSVYDLTIAPKSTESGYNLFGIRNSGILYQIELDQLLNNTSLVTYSSYQGYFSAPREIEAFELNNKKHLLISNTGTKPITHIVFDQEFSNIETIDSISFESSTIQSNAISIFEGENLYAAIGSANGSSVSVYTYNSVTSKFELLQEVNLTGVNGITGLESVKTCDGWKLMASSIISDTLLTLSFSSGLSESPIIQGVSLGIPFSDPAKIKLYEDRGEFFLVVQTVGGNLIVSRTTEEFSQFESVEINTNYGSGYGLHALKTNNDWVVFAFSSQNYLYQSSFLFDCEAQVDTSSDFEPINISYNTSGNQLISLTAIDENGAKNRYLKEIFVSPSTAPDITFAISSNQCMANPNTFTSTNLSGNITSYSWDFDGDGVEDSTDPNPTYQFAEAGTYEVRLSVESDEGCGNFAQESITIYPEPPVPVFTVPKDSFCVGEPVVISNLTDDAAWDGIVEYVWTVTDLTDTTNAAPELTFAQPGEKIIRVVSQIPGCESIEVTDTVQVIESPVVDFTADPVCDGETTIFTNNSEVGTILWDFGDGNTSTELNPTHTFATPNTYSVSLAVTNDLECTTTLVKEVAVNAIPQANFQYDLVCAGSESIFEDMSVVDQADISSWQWLVDGELVSEDQFPVIMFPTAGDYTVRLIAGSTKGCESFYEEVVTAGAAPDAGIGIELGCLGEATVFSDLTDPAEVLTRSWMIDGQPYNTASPAVIFNEPGDYEVELTVTNNQLCSSIVTETFTIHELAIPDFTILGQCNNEIIRLEGASTSTTDPIASRRWFVDGTLVGQGTSATITGYQSGTYAFTLEITTENGCVLTSDKTFEIAQTPVASFTASNDYGVPPFRLDFSNTSQMASVNEWYVNDALITTNPSPSIVFNDSGSQHVKLITYNSTGCADTAEMFINAIEPVVDLVVSDVQLVDGGNNYDIVLDVKNSSNLPIEAMSVNIELQNQFSVTEQVYQRINSGQESIVMLGTSVPKSSNAPAYLCISISSAYEEPPANLINNEACITIQPKISFEPPYPNPATTETSLRYILPEGGEATIEVFDVGGNLEMLESYKDLPKGLNQFILNITNLDAGTYLVKFRYKGDVIVSKIIKL